ncbi:MAG TPA: hypothetical protein VM100_00060 [Longimicrobiales bacterium]|nr:hypothetical protein [Longimicrobiales bacterium]
MLIACNKPEPEPELAGADSVQLVAAEPNYVGPKACDLLASYDIKQITGVEYKLGETANDYRGDSQCRFVATSDSSEVVVSLHVPGDLANYGRVPGATAVAAMGDSAVWNADIGQLAVKHGEAVLSISLMNQIMSRKTAERLARKTLEKL